ncbi:PTS sugar transporter subunit IIA [Olsenella sp. YH-ols2217]|uniref:PTS sugar transporter subunit IIA n=1 Tax=Kribbibacterium absianum TaxID=3044210 RepID=A0ABT6ZJ78_9ACTN|nr:PTS sugar transporter subunit IIA [Olsenella sp. YH-ols2217]MDJ1122668.1 PTS sugar transporter subunit IIA [Olsenella sp. YH-ols2216]MDJ1129106.1 PTS sugar transporter subunit IIA [Olsenella sp. YH-ols2217]
MLEASQDWCSTATLAQAVGVSERTVRNYVARLMGEGVAIESSRAGYRIRREAPAPLLAVPEPVIETDQTRAEAVLIRLLDSTESVSLYELSDSLALSESTVSNTVLPRWRAMLASFEMRLVSHDFTLAIEGTEQDKRRLMGSLASRSDGAFFTSEPAIALMFPGINVAELRAELARTCEKCGLAASDYAINNLLVHLLVIMERLASGHRLDDIEDPVNASALLASLHRREEVLRGAGAIVRLLQERFGVEVPERDFRQVTLLLALSIDPGGGEQDLAGLMDPSFREAVTQILGLTAERFGLEPFDDDFCLRITLHMFNAYQRAVLKISCPNPIAGNLKRDHMPVYDMAVFFCHRFSQLFHVQFSEDELGFIAFHIGAYLEQSKAEHPPASCVVVTERYHDFSDTLLAGIESNFHNRVMVKQVLSRAEWELEQPEAELVVDTSASLPPAPGRVAVSPILTRHDVHRIRRELDAIEERREGEKARAFLRHMLSPNLYLRESPGSPEECIRRLVELAQGIGVVDEGFLEDVLLRERLSSTAFTDQLAIPHTLDHFAKRSFVAVLHAQKPVPWERHEVSFVLLVGLAREERGNFSDAMEVLVDAFSDMDTTLALLRTRDFDEFASTLCGVCI